jgi:hypothetical protein
MTTPDVARSAQPWPVGPRAAQEIADVHADSRPDEVPGAAA